MVFTQLPGSDVWSRNRNCTDRGTITHLRATYANCHIRKPLPIQTPRHNAHHHDGFYDNCDLISAARSFRKWSGHFFSAINSVLLGPRRTVGGGGCNWFFSEFTWRLACFFCFFFVKQEVTCCSPPICTTTTHTRVKSHWAWTQQAQFWARMTHTHTSVFSLSSISDEVFFKG